MMKVGELGERWAVAENQRAKVFEIQGRQVRVSWPNKILVKPLRLFNLEADAFRRGQLFFGEVDDESHA